MYNAPVTGVGPNLGSALQGLLARQPLLENRYFQSLRDGSMDLAGFRCSQLQFFFAVRFFPRPMAALAARLPDSRSRMPLIHNLAEEHGDFSAPQAHDQTFRQFLGIIGVDAHAVAAAHESSAVRAFNLALLGACSMADTELAFASLGIIEHTFASISTLIGQAVVGRGWVESQRLIHYALHSEIDERHAAEFFGAIEGAWTEGGEKRTRIEEGLALGLYLFDRLYSDLHQIAREAVDE